MSELLVKHVVSILTPAACKETQIQTNVDNGHFAQLFLVSAFLVKSARLLQWLVFFRQTTISL